MSYVEDLENSKNRCIISNKSLPRWCNLNDVTVLSLALQYSMAAKSAFSDCALSLDLPMKW